jgi:GH15 family glucan-1,4-alpha-glucosidase
LADVTRVRSGFNLLNTLGVWLPVIALVLLVLGVYVAKDHRRALVGAGVGIAVAMVVLALGLAIFRSLYLDAVPAEVLPHDAAAVLYDTIVRFLRLGLRTVLVLGLYGIAGERRLEEYELDWLPGYEGSKPVRVGNAAAGQFQLDVYGEVLGVGWAVAMATGQLPARRWSQLRKLMNYLETAWRDPDDGMWEARGPRRHYTQSKVMAWVAFDRAIALAEHFGLEGPLERWRRIRAEIHDEILDKAYDPQRNAFTQSYGSKALDAGALMIGLVGLLPSTDDRFTGTIDAVRSELGHDGFISRYSTDATDDGLSGSEGQFLACSFWLVDALALNGRVDQARELFERLLALRNDLGLYAEEYDVARKRQVGNFPQAFTHLALINAARILSGERTGTRSTPPAPALPTPTWTPGG